jgi:hypothetical protein
MKVTQIGLVLALALVFSAPTRAAPDHGAAGGHSEESEEEESSGPLRQASLFTAASSPVPWRGSQVVLRNAVTAISLDPSAEQTYNPYYAMVWSFRPWWWFGDRLYVRAQLDVIHELTEPDETTYRNEALLDDLHLVLGGAELWRVPYADVSVAASLLLTLPTSKASRARTLVLGIGPGLRLSRAFPVLEGLAVGYNLRVTPRFHRYTTSERETPLIPGCASGVTSCDAYLNTGVRNPALRLSQSVDASLRVLDWLGVALAVGHAIDWLYHVGDEPVGMTYQPIDDQDRRFLTFLELAVSFRPLDLLEIGVGYSAVHPQLAPDSSYYVPFFNRYSTFFVDLKLDGEGVVSRIRRTLK